MLEHHFTDVALGQLPPGFRELTTEGSGPHDEMVVRPRLDEFVFCKITKTLGDVEVDLGRREARGLEVDREPQRGRRVLHARRERLEQRGRVGVGRVGRRPARGGGGTATS